MGFLPASVFRGIVEINCFFSKKFRNFFKRGLLFATQEQHAVTVAYNCFGMFFIERLKLTLDSKEDSS